MRSSTIIPALCASLALLAGAATASAPAQAEDEPIVGALEIRCDEPLARRVDLAAIPAFAVGDPLTAAAVRRTLSNAHATGLFADVEVRTAALDAEVPGSVAAILVLRGFLRVREVRLETARGAGRVGARVRPFERRLLLQEGQILDEDDFAASLEALRDAWSARGYRDVEIQAELVPTDAPNRVDLRVRVEPGPRPTVGEIVFEGLGPGPDPALVEELRASLRSEVGAPWRPDRLDDERRRLLRFWFERGHLRATVAEPESIDTQDGAVRLVFAMDPGSEVAIDFVGLRPRPLRKKGLLPFYDDGGFSEAALRRAAGDIETSLQGDGHMNAEVDVTRLADTDTDTEMGAAERWRLEADPGPKFRLERVDFDGNETITSSELRRVIATSVRSRLDPGSGVVVAETLAADIESLRSYYLLEGFPEVEVGPVVVRVEEDGPGSVRLEIPIREGPRQRVVDLQFVVDGARGRSEGSSPLGPIDAADALSRLPLRPGGPFHPLLVDDAVDVLRTLFEEEGHRAATIEPLFDWNEERTLVDVSFRVAAGPRTEIDRLVLRGLVRTRPDIVREFADLAPGTPLSRRALLRAERDLYRLGVFSRVEVEPAPSGPSPPSSGVRRRDVLVDLEEGSLWRVSYGLSFHSDDGVGGLLGFTRSHLGGRAARLQLDLRASANDNRLRLIYDDPAVGGRRVPLTWTLFLRDEERPSFSVSERGAQVALIRNRERLGWGLVFDVRQVDTSGVIDPVDLDREDQEIEITSLTPNLFWDQRDDPLDPRRGGSTAVQLEWAYPVLGTEADFLEVFAQQTWHHDLHDFGVLAWSLRLGAIEPFDPDLGPDPFLPDDLANSQVPISERFFAGGRTTHRAYERDRLGELGRTITELDDQRLVANGGNGLLLANLDYRFPIAGDFGGVVWADAGNVWAAWQDIDVGELRLGAGVGLRYRSPIGPVRLEIGWKLDPRPFENADPVFFLSFGNPF